MVSARTFIPEPQQWFFRNYWKVEHQPSSFAPDSRWSNKDMDVVPPHLRTWRSFDYLFLWASDGLNVGTMQQASSMIALGLSWRQVFPALVVGNFIISAGVTLNGRYHIPFSVSARSAFGFYGAYFAVVSRLMLALIYFGINSQIGGQCMAIMLGAIWPSFLKVKNALPASAGITTQALVGYFVFWLVQLPLMMIPPRSMRYLFLAKSVIVLVAAFALLGWSIHTAGGSGKIFAAGSTLTGSTKSWAWVYALNSAISGKTTLAINNPDLSRYARRKNDQYWQLLYITVTYSCLSLVGIAIASASTVIYGKTLWNPLDILSRWDSRAARFFAACAFMLAQAGTNISTNSIASQNDLVYLFPRCFNLRRGAVFTAIVGGWATAPWKIQASGSTLLSFLSGYAIVLAPILSVLISDFWLSKRQALAVPDLYKPTGIYTYGSRTKCNWRAFVTLLVVIPINIPGLAHAINKKIAVSEAYAHFYSFAWLQSFFITAVLYTTLSLGFKPTSVLLNEPIYDDDDDDEYEDDGEDGSSKQHLKKDLSMSSRATTGVSGSFSASGRD